MLPALGIVGLLFAVVGAWSWLFDVKPFIAPSPLLVLQTLFASATCCCSNLVPTAIEAAGGFLLGNLAAILRRDGLRAQQDAAGHLLPGRA